MTIKFYLHVFGETLGFLCLIGLIAAWFRFKTAERKEFVVAFAMVMAGIITREFAVWKYDSITWTDGSPPLYFVTVSRVLILCGAITYIWGASRHRKNGVALTMVIVLLGFLLALFVI
jgi:cytochrome c oxidase subunit IV